MTSPEVAIIADDLTGCLDAAVPFARRGMVTVAATSLAGLPDAMTSGAPVVAVSIGSRELPAAEAAARASHAAKALAFAGIILKKIDSRLKGHIGAEVGAVLAARPALGVLVCPAIPDMGRIVEQGSLVGSGVDAPIAVRGMCALPDGTPAVVADAATDEDLDRIVEAAGEATLFVGARGLASAIARRVAGRRPRKSGFHGSAVPVVSGPVAYVIGSRDPITLRQVERLRNGSGVEWVGAPDGLVPDFQADGSVVLQAIPGPGLAVPGETVSRRLARGYAARHLSGTRTLVLSGGETAAAVLEEMGIRALWVMDEVSPGMPVCRMMGGAGELDIITKSGGFGGADALLRLLPGHRSEVPIE